MTGRFSRKTGPYSKRLCLSGGFPQPANHLEKALLVLVSLPPRRFDALIHSLKNLVASRRNAFKASRTRLQLPKSGNLLSDNGVLAQPRVGFRAIAPVAAQADDRSLHSQRMNTRLVLVVVYPRGAKLADGQYQLSSPLRVDKLFDEFVEVIGLGAVKILCSFCLLEPDSIRLLRLCSFSSPLRGI